MHEGSWHVYFLFCFSFFIRIAKATSEQLPVLQRPRQKIVQRACLFPNKQKSIKVIEERSPQLRVGGALLRDTECEGTEPPRAGQRGFLEASV